MKLRATTDPEGVTWLAAEDVVDLLHRRADIAGDDAALRLAADQLYDLADQAREA